MPIPSRHSACRFLRHTANCVFEGNDVIHLAYAPPPNGEAPQWPQWLYELKLDGYRAIAFKSGVKIHIRSRNNKDFVARYPSIAAALCSLPDETVIDGEIVGMDDEGRPPFNVLQNYGASSVSWILVSARCPHSTIR
jgi:bifunctional non-homologous end joining protein LigD